MFRNFEPIEKVHQQNPNLGTTTRNSETPSENTMKTRALFPIVAVIAACILPVASSFGADEKEPSLQETLKFIKEKVDKYATYINDKRENYTVRTDYEFIPPVAGSQVTLKMSTSSFSLVGRDRLFTKTLLSRVLETIDLSRMNPEGKVVEGDETRTDRPTRIMFDAHGDYTWRFENDSDVIKATRFVIEFEDVEQAKKVAKALSHAIKLSGGKKDLF